MKTQKVGCGDWHRSWGMGTNHIGKLENGDQPGVYVWKGHQQGRHGQTWNRGQVVTFRVTGDDIEVLSRRHAYDSLPDKRDVMEAIRVLNLPETPKRARRPKQQNATLNLF